MDIPQFEARKRDHIRHALDPAHQATGHAGLEKIHLVHEALPDLDFEEISLEAVCLGSPASKPFYIAGMTAGHAEAAKINLILARAASEMGWAMGVGSQRRDLEGRGGGLDEWLKIREEVPRLQLFANIGISQAIETPTENLRRLVDSIRAEALVIHANALQEAIQPEGTPRFKGALSAITRICRELSIPVVLKETGCGFSERTLRRLSETGLSAVDVSGLGGTHWGRIEGARSGAGSVFSGAADVFANWGEPTADAILAARVALPRTEIWASGGIRSGLDAAKAIALGAHRVGYAQPALAAAMESPDKLNQWMVSQEFELKVALFCTGSRTPAALREKEGAWKRNAT